MVAFFCPAFLYLRVVYGISTDILEVKFDEALFGMKMETPKVSQMWRDLQQATSRLVFKIAVVFVNRILFACLCCFVLTIKVCKCNYDRNV